MTPAEIANTLVALVAVGGFILSLRSASYTELRKLHEDLRIDLEKEKKRNDEIEEKYKNKIAELEKKYQAKIDELEFKLNSKNAEIDELKEEVQKNERQSDNFKRYIVQLLSQMDRAGIKPEKMLDE